MIRIIAISGANLLAGRIIILKLKLLLKEQSETEFSEE